MEKACPVVKFRSLPQAAEILIIEILLPGMMEKVKVGFKENKRTIIILLLILAVGIFLRTYKFHDWMRFSRDQARDARIVTDALRGEQSLPLMGPKAGGTSFLLGPAYYYFSFASGKIFGNYPDKFAYPSLLFSILAIPLLFLLMREYFDRKISLIVTAIMSVSYFFIVSSRFSSNPNIMPFFLLLYLYALLKISEEKNEANFVWSILAGISLGIGIQLHTMYLVIMPIITAIVFAELLIKKEPGIWKKILVIICVVLLLNATQIFSEVRSNWQNSRNFIAGFNEKSTKSSFSDNIQWVAACQIQANFHFLTSLQDNDACTTILKAPSKKFKKNLGFYSKLTVNALFSIIGYILLILAVKRESDERRKNFLKLMALLNITTFGIFLFVAKFLEISYFVILLTIPFVLLGIMFESIGRKYQKLGKISVVILSALIIMSGFARDYRAAKDYREGMGDGSDSTTLGNIEMISEHLLSYSKEFDKLYLTGSKEIVGRFNPPLKYFIEEAGKTLILSWELNNKIIEPGFPMFYIETSSKEIVPGKKIGGREVMAGERFFRQVVLTLKN
jgi:4-amino-4-deoxy-L-arabinose transferase-like glycosyltransferase